MNVQLLKAADFNQKLRDRGVPKSVTVQKICRASKDEREVREIIESVWNSSETADSILSKAIEQNKQVYDFEQMLEETGKMQ